MIWSAKVGIFFEPAKIIPKKMPSLDFLL